LTDEELTFRLESAVEAVSEAFHRLAMLRSGLVGETDPDLINEHRELESAVDVTYSTLEASLRVLTNSQNRLRFDHGVVGLGLTEADLNMLAVGWTD
jgi:hypothetical protein